jgi:hypothetical protein
VNRGFILSALTTKIQCTLSTITTSRSAVIQKSLTYPSEKLMDTVGTAVTLMECMMAEVAHLNLVEQHITAAIKNSIDFGLGVLAVHFTTNK